MECQQLAHHCSLRRTSRSSRCSLNGGTIVTHREHLLEFQLPIFDHSGPDLRITHRQEAAARVRVAKQSYPSCSCQD